MTRIRTGPPPYGYKREEARLVSAPGEAPVVLYIFELFAEHERRKTVCEILYAEGKRTRVGALFTSPSVTRILENKSVLGVNGEVEQLVSEDLWNRCQLILQSQKGKGGAPRKTTNLFSGVTFCGCGQKMYVQSGTPKYVCPDCRTKIAKDDLEEVFVAQLESYPLPDFLSNKGKNLLDIWKTLDGDTGFEQKRKLVESITKRIDVTDQKVTCSLLLL